MKRVFVRTALFDRKAKQAGVDENSVREFELELMRQNMTMGTHITSNIWKVRWTRPGTGKSGGVRIFYFDYPQLEYCFLLTLFSKNEKDNLSPKEIALLADMVKEIKHV